MKQDITEQKDTTKCDKCDGKHAKKQLDQAEQAAELQTENEDEEMEVMDREFMAHTAAYQDAIEQFSNQADHLVKPISGSNDQYDTSAFDNAMAEFAKRMHPQLCCDKRHINVLAALQ